jgi:hypothetical protein
MVRALRVFAMVWSGLAVLLLVLDAMGILVHATGVWGAASAMLFGRLRPFAIRVNPAVLVLFLPAVAAFLWAAWRARDRTSTPELSPEELAKLVRGLHEAAAATNDVAGQHFAEMLAQFFDPTEDGTMKPKVVRVQVDDQRYVMVPLVSLLPSAAVNLDAMRVQFRCVLGGAEASRETLAASLPASADPGSLGVKITPRGKQRGKSVVDVSLEFKPGERPQATAELLNLLASSVSPVAVRAGEAPPPMGYAKSERFQELLRQSRERATSGPSGSERR